MEDLKKILINGNEIEVDSSLTILQACEQHGIELRYQDFVIMKDFQSQEIAGCV